VIDCPGVTPSELYELRERMQLALHDFIRKWPERPAKIALSPALWSRYVIAFHRPGSLQDLERDLRFPPLRQMLTHLTFMGVPVVMSETSTWPEIIVTGKETFAEYVRRKSLSPGETDAFSNDSEG
jgi:hypothetical protein